VGVPAPEAVADTVAMNVTDCPTADGFVLDANAVVVPTGPGVLVGELQAKATSDSRTSPGRNGRMCTSDGIVEERWATTSTSRPSVHE